MTIEERLLADIERWDRRYNGYIQRTNAIVDAWAIMLKALDVIALVRDLRRDE